MKVGVYGLWHLGAVTAACMAARMPIVAIDKNLDARASPLEPGLEVLTVDMVASGKLAYALDERESFADLDVLWVCFDTPLDHNEVPETDRVIRAIEARLPWLRKGCVVLISSQLKVGCTRALADAWPGLIFAYSPENIRRGRGIDTFNNQKRVIVGVSDDRVYPVANHLFGWCPQIQFMSLESAEMVKHALNAYLATCIVLINELADVCTRAGADIEDVERALLTEERVSPKAPLRHGGPFTGSTLARELQTLISLLPGDLFFSSVLAANRLRVK